MKWLTILALSLSLCSAADRRGLLIAEAQRSVAGGGGDASPSFTLTASRLLVHLKSSSITGNDGTSLEYWGDSSSNDWAATNPAPTKPIIGTWGTNKIATFFGTNHLFLGTNNPFGLASGVSNFVSFMVLRPAADLPANAYSFSVRGAGTGVRFGIRQAATNSHVIRGSSLDADAPVSAGTANLPPGYVLVCAVGDYVNDDAYTYTNGVLSSYDSTWGITPPTTQTNDSSAISIGSNAGLTAWKGGIAEWILLSAPGGDLATADRQSIESYFTNRFGAFSSW